MCSQVKNGQKRTKDKPYLVPVPVLLLVLLLVLVELLAVGLALAQELALLVGPGAGRQGQLHEYTVKH
jgi:hypothetical protein